MFETIYTSFRVTLLTITVSTFIGGCAGQLVHTGQVNSLPPDISCNSRAHIEGELDEFITSRYHSNMPARLGVVPFITQANLAERSSELPGLGNELTSRVQTELLTSGVVPIAEVLNRQDWPRKKEEFSTGNFGALRFARDAGYDLALVGFVQPIKSINRFISTIKILDTESNITVWSGEIVTEVYTRRATWVERWLSLRADKPSHLPTARLTEYHAKCIVRALEDSYGRGRTSSAPTMAQFLPEKIENLIWQ